MDIRSITLLKKRKKTCLLYTSFFDWDDESGQDGLPDHVGIVQKVEDGRVYTVEGNSGDECRQNSYPTGYYEIYGYGVPAY